MTAALVFFLKVWGSVIVGLLVMGAVVGAIGVGAWLYEIAMESEEEGEW